MHAEQVAVVKALRSHRSSFPLSGCLFLCEYAPCTNCANLINESGLCKVLVYEKETPHDPRGLQILSCRVIRKDQVTDADVAEWSFD